MYYPSIVPVYPAKSGKIRVALTTLHLHIYEWTSKDLSDGEIKVMATVMPRCFEAELYLNALSDMSTMVWSIYQVDLKI